MLNAWIAELTTQARSLSLQHRISEAVDGKAGERPKKLMADLEKVRLSIAEARAIIADLG
jgi:hypothetical protein